MNNKIDILRQETEQDREQVQENSFELRTTSIIDQLSARMATTPVDTRIKFTGI
jgi:hypothetical protein